MIDDSFMEEIIHIRCTLYSDNHNNNNNNGCSQ